MPFFDSLQIISLTCGELHMLSCKFISPFHDPTGNISPQKSH